jgi:hypothetical protein
MSIMESGNTIRPRVEIFLNNNPRCSVHLENVAKGEIWDKTNIPSITVKGSDFHDGKETMTVIFKGDVIAEEEISVVERSFAETIELSAPLESPEEVEVKVGTDFHRKIPVELRRLYGTATYFDGTPVKCPIINAFSGIAAVGDEEGNFEIFLCGKEIGIGVFEENYSKTTLECWFRDIELKEDTRVDVKIDKLEVYRLHAWEGEVCIYIHFIPMSQTRTSELMRKRGITSIRGREDEIALVSDPDLWPHLEADDVRVFIGETEVPILTFTEVDDFLFSANEETFFRPGYILAVPKKDYIGKIIKVEITDAAKKGEKEILEKGEGYFFGFVKSVREW